jgi:hypothetical protein
LSPTNRTIFCIPSRSTYGPTRNAVLIPAWYLSRIRHRENYIWLEITLKITGDGWEFLIVDQLTK